jgi:hypothetical protein
MKARYPLSAIQLAFEFFGQGCVEEFAALCAEMAEIAGREGEAEGRHKRLLGELLLMGLSSTTTALSEWARVCSAPRSSSAAPPH